MHTPTIARRVLSSVALSATFLVLYNLCNHLPYVESAANVFRFDWETAIPFIPWMIAPYMLLDAFFVAAPLLASSKDELLRFERLVVTSILIACAVYLFVPLKCISVKPELHGTLGAIFERFLAVDRPYNQLPSLHVVLSLVLAEYYWRQLKSAWRHLACGVLLLSAVAALYTYQHHAIDVIGGALLAAALLLLMQPAFLRRLAQPTRIGLVYLMAAFNVALIAYVKGGVAVVLMWPAFSFFLVFMAYMEGSASRLPKFSRSFAWVKRLALLPVTVGHRLSHRYYARFSPAWSAVADAIVIGRYLNASEASKLKELGIGAVLDLCSEFEVQSEFADLKVLSLPILDLTAPNGEATAQAVAFIQEHAKTTRVYVHCKAGYSRTAAIVGCWLLSAKICQTAQEAMALLMARRPNLVIRAEARASIQGWERMVRVT